ncbi:MotA/TolQ/ExbB proton channel family protein [Flavobacterium silvaticum]|uniref:MotA/TolQ/ExbB proton channel family protein n=1 Tax=Flavobacterium silvaticum TaxID=1852020 RepID=A0A972FUK3_9FLAO|nr:MotA/TolQ/ExbB proton channel family protein [Flavobacterium silvaticum]NMH27860.1 MotA/TolQ/ExbB proton channel family protein [Flavobacterium silvaticum]
MPLLTLLLQAETVQDTIAAANTAAATTTAAVTEKVSYLEFVLKGGAMIYPLILLLFFCIYVIIERAMTIRKLSKQDANLLNEVRSQLRAGRIENAALVCAREGNSSAAILKAGIQTIGRPISEIESVMEKTANIEIAKMEKGLGYLGLISGVAPILGFIGTIAGVIKIFHSISTTGNLNIQTISGGLYEKMISSGAGLVVGVIAYSGYHLYNMMIDSYTVKAEAQTLELINIIQSPDGN